MDYKELLYKNNKIYERLQDNLSREIYEARIMNSLTYDYNYITKIALDKVDILLELRKLLAPYIAQKKKLILDGAGYYGKSIKMSMPDIEFECFSDKNPQSDYLMGIPVLQRKKAAEIYKDAVFIVDSLVFCKEIRAELEQMGVECILDYGEYIVKNWFCKDTQYYDVLAFNDDEVIVDVGCFDCNSMMKYFEYGNTRYKKIYSFEPEPEQYMNCKKIIAQSGYDNWEIFNCGACDENKKMRFVSNGSCTKISDSGDIEVTVIKLDDFLKNMKHQHL